MERATLDRIRVLNKHVTNKIMRHICGRKFGHFAILTHFGRKSGKAYRIPIIAERIENGFVIAMTYGKKVDWYANMMAKGRCSLYWKKREYSLTNPVLVDRETGLMAFPKIIQTGLRRAGTQYFVKLDIQ